MRDKRFYARHRSEILEKCKKHRLKNIEHYKNYDKIRDATPERKEYKRISSLKAYYKHREEYNKKGREYYYKNKEVISQRRKKIRMKKKRLLTLSRLGGILLILVVVVSLLAGCGSQGPAGSRGSQGPAGPAGPPGPPATASVASLVAIPDTVVEGKKATVTLLGAGVAPGADVHIRAVNNGLDQDYIYTEGNNYALLAPLEVNENGAFETVMLMRGFAPGTYTLRMVVNHETLATTVVKVVAAE